MGIYKELNKHAQEDITNTVIVARNVYNVSDKSSGSAMFKNPLNPYNISKMLVRERHRERSVVLSRN